MVINLPNYERQTTILDNTNTIIENIGNGGLKRYVRSFPGPVETTFVVPAGVTSIFISGCGAGGSGAAGISPSTTIAGNAGGMSSVGTFFSFPGGGGGGGGFTAQGGAPGGKGGEWGSPPKTNSYGLEPSRGGSVWFFKGGYSGAGGSGQNGTNGGFGCGGGGTFATGFISACGGSGHATYNRMVNVTPGASIPVIVGRGGAAVTNEGVTSGAGGDGYIEIEWWAK